MFQRSLLDTWEVVPRTRHLSKIFTKSHMTAQFRFCFLPKKKQKVLRSFFVFFIFSLHLVLKNSQVERKGALSKFINREASTPEEDENIFFCFNSLKMFLPRCAACCLRFGAKVFPEFGHRWELQQTQQLVGWFKKKQQKKTTGHTKLWKKIHGGND